MLEDSARDHGSVELVDWLGSDLTPVNAARKSYNRAATELTAKDVGVLNTLLEQGHESPFRHPVVQFIIEAPVNVARQWEKHRIGAAYTFHAERERLLSVDGVPIIDDVEIIEVEVAPDLMRAWNERSFRYTKRDLRWHVPTAWRPNKNESHVEEHVQRQTTFELINHIEQSVERYRWALGNRINPEQARYFLPAYALMTSWMWTVSLQAIMHFIALRRDYGAQYEIRQYTDAVEELVRPLFPETMTLYARHLEQRRELPERIRALSEENELLRAENQRLKGVAS